MAAAESSRLVQVDNLYVSRDSNPVLRDVSLTVDRGETVAVCGGNGSGKSTLIKAITGLLPFREGSISLFGTPVGRFKQWHRIGYVPQHSSINLPNATVWEIASSGRLPHRLPFLPQSAKDRKAVEQALDVVGLHDRATWPFASLSGGQRQRTLIARALCTEPDLFVMDEPMAGVDLHSQAGLAQLLGKLVHDRDKGLLVVLHEIGNMDIDREITLCDGRVVDGLVPGEADHHPTDPVAPSPFGFPGSVSEVGA